MLLDKNSVFEKHRVLPKGISICSFHGTTKTVLIQTKKKIA